MLEILANWIIPKYMNPYIKVLHKPLLNIYTLLLPTTLVVHPTFHVSKLKPFNEDKRRKDRKHAYHPRFDLIKHKLTREAKCILATRHTKCIGKQYLVKWKRCHLKESQWVKLGYLDHLLEMVDKFEWG
jgi:hypothetical protein